MRRMKLEPIIQREISQKENRAAVLCGGRTVCGGLGTASRGGRHSQAAGWGPGSSGRCRGRSEKGSGLFGDVRTGSVEWQGGAPCLGAGS